MKTDRRSLNMLEGSLWDKLIIFALPLALTGLLQQLYNMADVATLGHFVSDQAMGAVGTNVPVIGLIVSFFMGLSLGANVVVARFLGMKNEVKASAGVHTAFATAVAFGLLAAACGLLLSGWIMDMMGVPEGVRSYALDYLRVYLCGMPFVCIYNFLAAIFRSTGDTRTPLYALCFASAFNVAGNLFFTLVIPWGAAGVALSTALANVLAAAILFRKLLNISGPLKLIPSKLFTFDREAFKGIVTIGWPAGLQGAVFSLSNLVIQSAINSLGPDVMAASVAGFTVEINVYIFINAFGLAATTFISQNFGAGNLERCRKITRISMWLNIGVAALLSLIVVGFGNFFLGFFTSNAEIIELAMLRLLWVVVPEPVSSVMEVLSDSMRGYGYSLPPAILTVIAICSSRILWVATAFRANPTFETVMQVYPLSWVLTSIGLTVLYLRFTRKVLPALKPSV